MRQSLAADIIPVSRPDILYHYTSAAGLLGIAHSKALWASDAEFLNDAQELHFGRDRMRRALLDRAETLSPEQEHREGGADDARAILLRTAADRLDRRGGPFDTARFFAAYVVCFCEQGDLLSQWRGYGVGGYAIGFRAEALEGLQVRADPETAGEETADDLTAALVQVAYGDAAAHRVAELLTRDLASDPSNHPGVEGFHRARHSVLPALAGIKHDAFEEEKEWRLVVVAEDHPAYLRFRGGSLGVIPYVVLRCPLSAIAEVVVGPGPEQCLREAGARRLVEAATGREIPVRHSDAPFRG
jgi:Protein of unknown function (DUF2971)